MEYLEENLHDWLGEELQVRASSVALRRGALYPALHPQSGRDAETPPDKMECGGF